MKVDAALDRGAGDVEHAEEKVSPLLFADLFSRVRVSGSCLRLRERERGCRTHLRRSWDPAWVLAAAWSPWRLSVSRRRG
jgi:hypothetical protein